MHMCNLNQAPLEFFEFVIKIFIAVNKLMILIFVKWKINKCA